MKNPVQPQIISSNEGNSLLITEDELNLNQKSATIVIAVMGVTGSGKSNFIRLASGLDDVVVGHDLTTGTQKPKCYDVVIGGRPVVLLDTPGFDDMYRGDAYVLAEIAETLNTTYENNVKISGIVYLHRIKDERMTNAILRNISMFKNLCGDDALKNVTLATTFWDELPNIAKGESREKQLLEKETWWGYMSSKGSRVRRFSNTQESALAIISELVELPPVALQIQIEMVDEGLLINKTTAGEALNSELTTLVVKHTEELKKMQEEMETAIKDRDVVLQTTISEMQAEKTEIIRRLENEQELLRFNRREEVRRMEQQFSDRILQMERENEKEMKIFEARLKREQQNSEQRNQEAVTQANEALQQLKEATEMAREEDRREYRAAIRELESQQESSIEERRRWERGLERCKNQLQQLTMAQAEDGRAERRQLEDRIKQLEIEKEQNMSTFWDLLNRNS